MLTVGWAPELVVGLCNAIAGISAHRFSHIVHPRYVRSNWPQDPPQAGIRFFRPDLNQEMPPANRELLASLETDDLPSLHNMILGDRVVSKLPYDDALGYATLISNRLQQLYEDIEPDVVITGFDAIHSGLALAVAKLLGIPAYAINFSVIPPGLVSLCSGMTPGSRVILAHRPVIELVEIAESSLRRFEEREIKARAYIAPSPPPLRDRIGQLPMRAAAVWRTLQRARLAKQVRFTEPRGSYDVTSAVAQTIRARQARRAIAHCETVDSPPASPYVLFGLHMQPESSIDVWAPFFSNQIWVIELLSRCIPPSHKLLIKIHKSDVSNYSGDQLDRMRAFPGVELVTPFADARDFIDKTALVIAIQGTMGLEASLIGKPVIMLGDSPVSVFPSASSAGALRELPALVRTKLAEKRPSRAAIVDAYVKYLMPMFPASDNVWNTPKQKQEIEGYVGMFDALRLHLKADENRAASMKA